MKHKLFGAAIALGLGLLGQGCVTLPGTGVTSASDIARDAAALNDAYSRASSGQILLNVLRARDRWPRQYVSLNGVTNQPTATMRGSLTLDALPLGASEIFESSNAEISREQHSAYGYGITPMGTTDISNAVLAPVKRDVFAHYWNSAWSEDVLLLVMGADMRRYLGPEDTRAAQGRRPRRDTSLDVNGALTTRARAAISVANPGASWTRPMRNRPIDDDATDGDPCVADAGYLAETWPLTDDVDDKCAYFQIVHRMLDHIYRYGPQSVRLGRVADPTCRESEAVSIRSAQTVTSMAEAAQASGGQVTVRLVRPDDPDASSPPPANAVVLARCPSGAGAPVLLEVMQGDSDTVAATYLLSLRSLDDMIYSLGVLLRPQLHEPLHLARGGASGGEPCRRSETQAQAAAAAREMRASGLPPNCVTAPLFWIETRGRGSNPVDYAAYVDYRGERVVAGPPVRGSGDNGGDRTATVLTLLTQLFALNFSPGAAGAPPQRINTN